MMPFADVCVVTVDFPNEKRKDKACCFQDPFMAVTDAGLISANSRM